MRRLAKQDNTGAAVAGGGMMLGATSGFGGVTLREAKSLLSESPEVFAIINLQTLHFAQCLLDFQKSFVQKLLVIHLGGWATDPVQNTIAASIRYHFRTHGADVGAKNVWQYLRKAEAFARNLRGARTSQLENGATRYMKNGRYVIKDEDGKIISYGLERQ